MRLHTATRTRITVDLLLDFDPTGTDVALKVDGTWYPCTWQGTPVAAGGKWTQTALTDTYFAGPTHPAPDGAVVLTADPYRHSAQTRVDLGGTEITGKTDVIDVVS